jgi:choline-sulfatase
MITRRAFLSTAASAAASAVTLHAANERPNLLIVMTDQQSADAMSNRMGRKYIHTPNMDSLAANGMSFSRAYCANPLCVPSRTSMFSGRYPTETGVQINGNEKLDPAKFPNMGTIFRNAGYATGFVGKWHMPWPAGDTAAHGFEAVGTKKGDHVTAASAVEFLRQRRDKPFLLVSSFLNPHNICEWARSEPLPDGEVGTPPALSECPPARANAAPPKDEPDIMTLMRRSYQSNRLFPVGNFDEKKWREYAWAYHRMIEKVDAEIGKVLAALRETGQEERTVVVFLADHGDCQGAHKWNQKTVFYEESSRVPLIISHKGVT